VTPFGDLIATPARGTLTGNRGRLHDPDRRVVRRIAGGYRAWVTCVLAFRGRHREVMTPNRYTELFFRTKRRHWRPATVRAGNAAGRTSNASRRPGSSPTPIGA
jgi:hypothetical protein